MNEILDNAPYSFKLYESNVDPILNELLLELHGFASLLEEYGVRVAIESPAARSAWAGLGAQKKKATLKNFSAYYRNCVEMHAAGISLRDNQAFVSHSLKRANLFAQDDSTSLFNNDHMVEVYNLNDIQVFRSINFFDYCNYSLLDLLAREWMDLYERLPAITKSIFREIRAAVAERKLSRFDTPAHVMKERDAIPRGVFKTDFLHCCPLYSAPGLIGGYLLVLDVAEIDLESEGEQKLAFFPGN